MSLETNMDRVLARRHDIEYKLVDSAALSSDQVAQLSRELAEIKPVAEQVEIVRQLQQSLSDAKDIAAEETDGELIELALAETEELAAQLPNEEHKLRLLLLPKDTDDSRNVIIEVRAGTGGDEAALFASDLFAMYQRFAAKYGWRFEVMDISETGIGGYKEATANISGQDVFARLKFESGVHRVQRVPETETGGRIHTSAATVAVLPKRRMLILKLMRVICGLMCLGHLVRGDSL